jgi:peroxiredoxin
MLNRGNTSIFNRCLLLLASLFIVASVQAAEISGPAPDFTLKSLSGENVKLSEYRGQVLLINFWASWCGPCRQEMPLLDKLHQRYAAYGFTVFGINVEENSEAAKKMIKDAPVSFPILFDTENSVSKAYNVSAMPSTVMVDRDGNMRYLHQGYKAGDEENYKKWIKQLIKE